LEEKMLTDIKRKSSIKRQINKAIQNPESFTLHFIYVSSDKVSIRTVSPYRLQAGDRFLGFDRIHKLSLVDSNTVLMPQAMTELCIDGVR
jgi:hypothetical protein